MTNVDFNTKLIRGYDIRGVYGEILRDEDAYSVGRCVASYVNPGDKLAVARDYRPSSPALAAKLIEGINSLGVHVLDLGCVPTPALYYSVRVQGELEGGVMVTGSHNALKYNGFKVLMRDREIGGAELGSLLDLGHALPSVDDVGTVTSWDVRSSYIEFLCSHIDHHALRSKRIVWGTSGGVSLEILRIFKKHLPDAHSFVVPPDDGRAPDPLGPENRVFMRESILAQKADMGIGFDGDADRCVFFDSKGEPILADYIFSFMADAFLKIRPNAAFVVDSKLAVGLGEGVRQRGGKVLYVPTGHTNIKAAMRTSNALLGGEMSGHYFFPYGGGHTYDDGLFAALRFLHMLGNVRWEDYVGECMPLWVTQEHRLCLTEEQVVLLRNAYAEKAESTEELPGGGVRYYYADGWAFLRPSRTEDLVSMRIEGKSAESFKNMRMFARMTFQKIVGEDVEL